MIPGLAQDDQDPSDVEIFVDDSTGPAPGPTDVVAGGIQVNAGGVEVTASS